MTDEIPFPGQPVRGSRTGKPIMALFDLLGRSWALGIIWQLSNGPMTFRQIQTACEQMSPTILNRRLKELVASSIVERSDHGYQLTSEGVELFAFLKPLGGWSKKWADALSSEEGQQ
ncbi:winged helix-turn-helix transcriptional regulator [Roseobacter sp. A03A-229]